MLPTKSTVLLSEAQRSSTNFLRISSCQFAAVRTFRQSATASQSEERDGVQPNPAGTVIERHRSHAHQLLQGGREHRRCLDQDHQGHAGGDRHG